MHPLRQVRSALSRLPCLLPAVLLALVASHGAGAASPGEIPSLRLETGMHVAPIRAASVDAGGRFAITASEDKTARVWDLASGALLSTFRPPSSPGNDGKLFAAAIAPDASSYAVAGWSAGNDVYLVGRSDGRIMHRITGLPNVVTHLSFSPDGKMLVVGLWGKHGIRVFSTLNAWQGAHELQGDANFSGEVNSSAWSPNGKELVVSSADGYLRAYEATAVGVKLFASNPSVGAGAPHGLAFSPDGRKLAVGASDQASVRLLDPGNLKPQKILAPPAAGAARGLSSVAWSADGQQLFAAGSWADEQGRFAACVWPDRGQGAPSSIPLAGNTITALSATANGGLMFASADPSWGVLDARGKTLLSVTHGALDFRNLRSQFRLARDGSALAFHGPQGGSAELAFDIRQAAWVKAGKEWQEPRSMAARSSVDNWFERQKPQINGRAVNLDSNELSLSASVSPTGERIAIATNDKLRLYDREGRALWQVPAPATPWQINISGDGRWVVAAFGDGTIRWHSQLDGSEQLAFFPHPDRRRWVMWTPSGYFAASPGGEELVGWQLDRGPARTADFYPVSRFRSEYYSPDLFGEVIGKGSVVAALATRQTVPQAIAERLPPTLRIISPEDMSTQASSQIKLRIAIRASRDAPVTSIRVRINGQLVSLPALASLGDSPAASPDESGFELPLALPEGDARIMLFAENRHGVSPEAVLRINRPKIAEQKEKPAIPVPASGPDFRPALYVLSIGISKYEDPSIRLAFAAKDATDLSNFLKAQAGGLYRKVSVRLLTDAAAKRDDVLEGLEWVRREMTARDVAIVFLAGHGTNDSDGVYYFLPQDVDPKHLKRSGVIFTEIRNTLVSLPGKALFFVDTCHAGNILGTGSRAIRNDTTAIVNELSSADNGVIVFAAATGRQYALESSNWGNGAFTKAILEGLRGQADLGKSGRITHKMLDLYISERVKRLTEGAQSPVTIVPNGVPDFPLVLGQR